MNKMYGNAKVGKTNALIMGMGRGRGRGRGRGIAQNSVAKNTCLCHRPYSFVLCNVCGYWTKGRVRHFCPIHPQTVFLLDITQCPQCKSCGFMLTEF
ncbi:unnamed protein product [Xylocopa violacea]|uniref:Uncharacterized protein n=1 Tax=Xylocopa violacea TaxID=135666 RepID=A0ABP1NCX7_XYLVO